jgi:hypothetical protein
VGRFDVINADLWSFQQMSEAMFSMRFPAEIKVEVYTTNDKNRGGRGRVRK